MQTTGNLGLKKPDGTDVVDIADFNGNADLIDTALGNMSGMPTAAKNAAGAITELKQMISGINLSIPDSGVTTEKLAAKSVTAAKIADNTIGSGQMVNGAITDTVIGNRTIDDTVVAATGADTPTRLWSKIANMIKGITGKSNWFTAPGISLETVSGRLNQAVNTTSSPTFVNLSTTATTGTAPFTVASSTLVSKLNADTVDGIHGTDLAPKVSPVLTGIPTTPDILRDTASSQIANAKYVYDMIKYSTILTNQTDPNQIKLNGKYDLTSNHSNMPSGHSGRIYIEVIGYFDGSYTSQTAYDFSNNKIWTRRQVTNTWLSWSEVGAGGAIYVTPSNNVLVSSLAEKTTNTSGDLVQGFRLKHGGKYRIKGELKADYYGPAYLDFLVGFTAFKYGNITSLGIIGGVNATTDIYSSFVIDFPYSVPPDTVLSLRDGLGKTVVSIRNVTVCGTEGNTNPSSYATLIN